LFAYASFHILLHTPTQLTPSSFFFVILSQRVFFDTLFNFLFFVFLPHAFFHTLFSFFLFGFSSTTSSPFSWLLGLPHKLLLFQISLGILNQIYKLWTVLVYFDFVCNAIPFWNIWYFEIWRIFYFNFVFNLFWFCI